MLSIFCNHDWQILSEKYTPSQMEHFTEVSPKGMAITKGSSILLERKFIQIVKCNKCGGIKRYVTEV